MSTLPLTNNSPSVFNFDYEPTRYADINAISHIDEIFNKLDKPEIERVLNYLNHKHSTKPTERGAE